MENKRTETNKTVQKRLEPELKLINMDTVEVEQIEWLLYPFIPYGKLCTTGKSRHCFLNKEAKPVSLKKENAVLHQKILTFIGKDVQDPDKKQDS